MAQERLRQVVRDHQSLCADALHDSECRHVLGLLESRGGAGAALVSQWLCHLLSKSEACGTCARALRDLLIAVAAGVDANTDNINFKYDALMRDEEPILGRRKRRRDEDYKLRVTSETHQEGLSNSGTSVGKLSGLNPTTVRDWEAREMAELQTAAFRVFTRRNRGTYRMAKDGKELGRPPRETQRSTRALCNDVGSCIGAY